jgi:hypothetical protein
MGKAKGMLQTLWVRGFIDEANIQQYPINGRIDAYGVVLPNTSLKSVEVARRMNTTKTIKCKKEERKLQKTVIQC